MNWGLVESQINRPCTVMLAASPIIRRAAYGISAGLFGTGIWWSRSGPQEDEAALRKRELAVKLPQRSQIINSLKSDKVFDVLVVGGGATGTGVALVRTLGLGILPPSFAPSRPKRPWLA